MTTKYVTNKTVRAILLIAVTGLLLASFFFTINEAVQSKVRRAIRRDLRAMWSEYADVGFKGMSIVDVGILNPEERRDHVPIRMRNNVLFWRDFFFGYDRKAVNAPGWQHALVWCPFGLAFEFIEKAFPSGNLDISSKSSDQCGELAEILDVYCSAHYWLASLPAVGKLEITFHSSSVYPRFLPQNRVVRERELIFANSNGVQGSFSSGLTGRRLLLNFTISGVHRDPLQASVVCVSNEDNQSQSREEKRAKLKYREGKYLELLSFFVLAGALWLIYTAFNIEDKPRPGISQIFTGIIFLVIGWATEQAALNLMDFGLIDWRHLL